MTVPRILVCLDSLAAGGAERQTVELVKRLDRRQFLPKVVSLHGPRSGQSRHFVPELQAAGIEVTELDRRWQRNELLGSLWAIRRCIRDFRPQLVHSVSHHCNHLTRFARLCSGHSFRLLTAIRTEYDGRQLRNERLEQRLSTFVVCNSPSMAEKLTSVAGLPTSRLRYIPNGLDIARFATSPDPGFRDRSAPGRRRIGLMLARITEQKAPDLLAAAVADLKRRQVLPADVEFWIVGERESPEVQARLDTAVRAGGVEAWVRQFPATTQPATFLHAADFSILASRWEGTPNSVLESLAAGRPALVSEGANTSGLIRPSVEGWIVPTGEVSALSRGLEQVLTQPSEGLLGMAESCRRRAAEFDMPTMVRRYETLYRELLGLT
jgi:glycosyltransferase involved in cell wall biosynthesis